MYEIMCVGLRWIFPIKLIKAIVSKPEKSKPIRLFDEAQDRTSLAVCFTANSCRFHPELMTLLYFSVPLIINYSLLVYTVVWKQIEKLFSCYIQVNLKPLPHFTLTTFIKMRFFGVRLLLFYFYWSRCRSVQLDWA